MIYIVKGYAKRNELWCMFIFSLFMYLYIHIKEPHINLLCHIAWKMENVSKRVYPLMEVKMSFMTFEWIPYIHLNFWRIKNVLFWSMLRFSSFKNWNFRFLGRIWHFYQNCGKKSLKFSNVFEKSHNAFENTL